MKDQVVFKTNGGGGNQDSWLVGDAGKGLDAVVIATRTRNFAPYEVTMDAAWTIINKCRTILDYWAYNFDYLLVGGEPGNRARKLTRL